MNRINEKGNSIEDQKIINIHNNIEEQRRLLQSSEVTDNNGKLSHISNCLITLTPITSDVPFQMFGSKTQSLSANKLLVREALYDQNDTKKITAGKVILEALISDEMLSAAMIGSDSDSVPITFINIGGQEIKNNEIEKNQSSLETAEDVMHKNFMDYTDAFKETTEELKLQLSKTRPSKPQMSRAMLSLQHTINHVTNEHSYNMEELEQALTRDTNSVKGELYSTIEKINFYKKSEQLRLTNEKNTELSSNILFWTANRSFAQFDKERYINILKNSKDTPTDFIKLIANLTIEPKRGKFLVSNGSLSINTTYGGGELCQENNISGKNTEFRFSNGYKKEGLNNTYTCENEFLRLSISCNDILFLLRGTVSSDFIIGTITRHSRLFIPLVKINHRTENNKSKTFEKSPDHNGKVNHLFKQIEFMLSSDTITKKQDREKAIIKLNTLEHEFLQFIEKSKDFSLAEQKLLAEDFNQELANSLQKTFSTLPQHIIDKTIKLINKK